MSCFLKGGLVDLFLKTATGSLRAVSEAGLMSVTLRGLLRDRDWETFSREVRGWPGYDVKLPMVIDAIAAVWPTRSFTELARHEPFGGYRGGDGFESCSATAYAVTSEVLYWYRSYALDCANEGVVCAAFTDRAKARDWVRQRARVLYRHHQFLSRALPVVQPGL